jgi:hypothetical protein
LGVPVIYFGKPDDSRVQILPHIGVEIHQLRFAKALLRTHIAELDCKINSKFVKIIEKFRPLVESGKAEYNFEFKAQATETLRRMVAQQLGV